MRSDFHSTIAQYVQRKSRETARIQRFTPAATKYFTATENNREIEFLLVPRVLSGNSPLQRHVDQNAQ